MTTQIHQINYDDLICEVIKKEIVCSYGNGSYKTLRLCIDLEKMDIFFEVEDGYNEIYAIDSLQEAIDKYNSIN